MIFLEKINKKIRKRNAQQLFLITNQIYEGSIHYTEPWKIGGQERQIFEQY